MSRRDPNRPDRRVARTLAELERGREHYEGRAWSAAYQSLSLAAEAAPLKAEDLERLATSAYLTGRDEDYLSALERSHHACLEAGEGRAAARCAFWLGLRLLFRSEIGRATGWFARAQRLLDVEADDCAEHGYLMLPLAEQQLAAGDFEAANASATRAAELGEHCKEMDLLACARHVQGRIRIQQGKVEEGLALLDEAMVAVTAGELSPIMSGLIYCSVIEACQQIYALRRSREWTTALSRWCEAQPELVAFTGVCRVHRAEILQLQGDWQEAIEEAQLAWQRSEEVNARAAAAGFYQLAEVHRLRGEWAAAEEAYISASRRGMEPQPGLALLRMAQGRLEAAAAAIHRALNATTDRLQRIKLLPAYVEIMLNHGANREARGACSELEEIAQRFESEALSATAAYARGALALAEGDAQAALPSLRRAFEAWQQLGVPYLAARSRVLAGLACRALGDHEGCELELQAARASFVQLGAGPDVEHADSVGRDVPSAHRHGLTPRELQVLRLVAAGKTNKTIAAELSLSGRTVDRHVSNFFRKLEVSSRAAATAYAYRQKLL